MGKKSPCLSCKHKNVYEPLTKCFVCNFSGIECKNFEMYKPNSQNLQTNADRIRAMSDEELAEMMAAHGNCEYCEIYDYCFSQKGVDCDEVWLDWLKQEADHDKR